MSVLSPQQYAQRLMTSLYSDGVTRTMRPGSDGAISVNITDLTRQEKWLARAALGGIGEVTGLQFRETTGAAQITYSHDGSGANTRTTASGTTINKATVRISNDRVSDSDGFGSFAFRTYMHETLHALGLGHPQDYGRVREFSQSAIHNDSWQISLMSYFDQNENTRVNATKAYQLTPMVADYLALKQMYGPATIHAGNTVYGVNSNAGGSLDAVASLGARAAFLIADSGGNDHVNFARSTAAQRIDLAPGAISDVMGAVGNMQIAPDTQIENATGGQGADRITGNAAANRLAGNAGNDLLHGRGGNDVLDGGVGNDKLWGEDGNDQLIGGAGNDSLYGGAGNDRLIESTGTNYLDGGAGNDVLIGGSGDDRLIGGAGSDSISGNAGNDRIDGGDGGDRLFGQAGNDRIEGGGGHDIIIGGAGNDTLYGGPGNDDLAAEGGSDFLDGGAGNDLLRGGAGADRFVFNLGSDTIRNFDPVQDSINLSSFSGLDSWADVRGQLTQAGNHVEFRQDGHTLRIEWTRLSDLATDDFIW
ncbi:M10 family metallopeptidase C-terminal domain-containing protein [Paracoccus sp. (in: a-proteobacteria)]|uniref:M10 family metallopeptidase C-terminal domain-containing protein n=1 Tax=Paracoccus sp. TaxID=267 RepID=UPI0026DFDF9E|nr:M10 family metallopeptidase C-terminal domain-containing protein [Paracoccus sp. (in: a-proteobacteria)]MDO5368850.1 M10 family metallopeptidase C-terminal domain-containing protein [Paracoccus sp. (in: a-proteobacteria)]